MTLPEQPPRRATALDGYTEIDGVLRSVRKPPRILPPPTEPVAVIDELASELQNVWFHAGHWLVWTGAQWETEDQLQIEKRLYSATGNALYRKSTPTTEQKLPWSPTVAKINNLVGALKAERALPASVRPGDWLDGRAPRGAHIACGNGLVRLADRQLEPHNRLLFNTVSSPFDYVDDGAPPTRWLSFLASVWPDAPGPNEDDGPKRYPAEEIRTLQQWFGYVLSGRTDLQKALMLIGPPRSGKGTIFWTLTQLIGVNNTAAFTLAGLSEQFGLESMVGKSLAIGSDVRWSRRVVNGTVVERILALTGEDSVQVPRKYKGPVEAQLGARLMVGSNEIPPMHDDSAAVASRFLPLRMDRSFLGQEDTGLRRAISAELPAILRWSLDGLADLEREGRFTVSAASVETSAALRESASPVAQFLSEACEVTGRQSDFVSRADLHRRWQDWTAFQGHRLNRSQAKLVNDIEAADTRCRHGQDKATGAKGVRGLRLRPIEPGVQLAQWLNGPAFKPATN